MLRSRGAPLEFETFACGCSASNDCDHFKYIAIIGSDNNRLGEIQPATAFRHSSGLFLRRELGGGMLRGP
ncbi:MAG: hypothetical protein C0478_11725 [Planctomyces sp.]|nr:hypothetical protein [Planctomyces sp.]